MRVIIAACALLLLSAMAQDKPPENPSINWTNPPPIGSIVPRTTPASPDELREIAREEARKAVKICCCCCSQTHHKGNKR